MKYKIIQLIWSIWWTLCAAYGAVSGLFGNPFGVVFYWVSTELAFTNYHYAFEKGIFNYAKK